MCNLVIIVSFWPQHVCCLKSRLTEVDYRFLSVISLPRNSKDLNSCPSFLPWTIYSATTFLESCRKGVRKSGSRNLVPEIWFQKSG